MRQGYAQQQPVVEQSESDEYGKHRIKPMCILKKMGLPIDAGWRAARKQYLTTPEQRAWNEGHEPKGELIPLTDSTEVPE